MSPLTWLVLAGVLASACAPAGGRSFDQPQRTDGAVGAPSKNLTLGLGGEPDFFILGIGGAAIAGVSAGELQGAVHQGLAGYDERGNAHPQLAVELPTQEKGSWLVRPDGTMRTTYRVREGVSWHDGVPLQMHDFVLGWTVAKDPDLPVTKRFIATLIADIQTPDASTLVIEWGKTYPFANTIAGDDLAALPTHILGSTYPADREKLQQSLYWTREFVGLGPFALEEWQPGSHLVLRAFDRFYGGRPKLDTITVRFIPSDPTLIANLLAGAIDGVVSGLEFKDTVRVKEEWEHAGRKPVFVSQTTHRRMLSVQFRPDIVSPREVLDVRLRRALLHAIDRQSLIEVVLAGQSPVPDSFIPPDDARWESVRDAVRVYGYDPTTAQQLMGDIGWQRGADGSMLNTAGERASIEIRVGAGSQEQETAIVADHWKNVGLAVQQMVLSPGQQRDQKFVSLFPAIHVASLPLTFEWDLQRTHGSLCPTEQSNWTGTNRGCYQNAEMDRVADALRVTIDSQEQRRLWREMARMQSQELPLLPIYFNVRTAIFREGVVGIKGTARPTGSHTWNAHEWDMVR